MLTVQSGLSRAIAARTTLEDACAPNAVAIVSVPKSSIMVAASAPEYFASQEVPSLISVIVVSIFLSSYLV